MKTISEMLTVLEAYYTTEALKKKISNLRVRHGVGSATAITLLYREISE